MHCVVDKHPMPTTAETVEWRILLHNINHKINSSFVLTKDAHFLIHATTRLIVYHE